MRQRKGYHNVVGGLTGPAGQTGSTGAPGTATVIQGPPGPQGFDGADGLDAFGIPGPRGDRGATGASGATGTAGGMVQIAQIVCAGSQTTVDFTSIPGTYTSLKILYDVQDTQAGTDGVIARVRINNDVTAADYSSTYRIGSQNSSAYATPVTPTIAGAFWAAIPQSGNTDIAATGEITLINYARTVFQKRILIAHGYDDGTLGGNIGLFTFRFKSTAPITRVTFATEGTAFTNGSTFTLYGLP